MNQSFCAKHRDRLPNSYSPPQAAHIITPKDPIILFQFFVLSWRRISPRTVIEYDLPLLSVILNTLKPCSKSFQIRAVSTSWPEGPQLWQPLRLLVQTLASSLQTALPVHQPRYPWITFQGIQQNAVVKANQKQNMAWHHTATLSFWKQQLVPSEDPPPQTILKDLLYHQILHLQTVTSKRPPPPHSSVHTLLLPEIALDLWFLESQRTNTFAPKFV
jgi:hypothetical protein